MGHPVYRLIPNKDKWANSTFVQLKFMLYKYGEIVKFAHLDKKGHPNRRNL